jgi:hypothetical protein
LHTVHTEEPDGLIWSHGKDSPYMMPLGGLKPILETLEMLSILICTGRTSTIARHLPLDGLVSRTSTNFILCFPLGVPLTLSHNRLIVRPRCPTSTYRSLPGDALAPAVARRIQTTAFAPKARCASHVEVVRTPRRRFFPAGGNCRDTTLPPLIASNHPTAVRHHP